MTTRLKTPNDIKKAFDELFDTITPEEQIEHDAQLLAFSFLSIIDNEMKKKNINRKELALKTGTSQAYITQLFRGNRKPNLNILAKIQKALDIEFSVTTKEAVESRIIESISNAHKVWIQEGCYDFDKTRKLSGSFEIYINPNQEPLAS